MKKFISMVMAAAMVVSLVPATAFAANTATFKVVNDKEYTETEAKAFKKGTSGVQTISGPEVQLKVTDVDSVAGTTTADTWDITLDFNNAELNAPLTKGASLSNAKVTNNHAKVSMKEAALKGDDTVKLTITEESGENLEDDDIISIDLRDLGLVLTKSGKGTKATVEVSGDFGDSDAMTFVSVLDTGIKATLKKVAEVAEEETTDLEKDLKIESNVSKFANGQRVELKLNSGFEWALTSTQISNLTSMAEISAATVNSDKDVLILTVANVDEFTISRDNLTIDAATAKVGAVGKITVKTYSTDVNGNNVTNAFKATADPVEAVKVVDNAVTLEVDKDEDVPVIYSGVNVNNDGITDDSDHKSLEITLKESAKGAFDAKKSFTLTLPEGVYATDVDVTDTEGTYMYGTTSSTAVAADVEAAFANAYKKGEQETFEFARKTFNTTDDGAITNGDKMDLDFTMTLIAEPGFEGDVTLTLGGDAFDKEQKVTIAKFVAPYKVEATQNDLIIDYRNTKVPTNVVVKEAEAGLWKKDDMTFTFAMDKDKIMELEDDAKITVDSKSGMEVKNTKDMKFTVKEESDDTAAVITISDIALYMSRDIAAGAYDLKLRTTAGDRMMMGDRLFTAKAGATGSATPLGTTSISVKPYYVADYKDWDVDTAATAGSFVAKAFTVKEGFVNVVTAGKDKDNTFTTKVVVPVGESKIYAGEKEIALDVPAYISAAGYTMLPVRAVATALGVDNSSVRWDAATKTVTIMYGQRIITMVAGQKTITVNGNTIPASTTVQIKDGRTFLALRDLATALNVADITWDAATKTATLNGNQK